MDNIARRKLSNLASNQQISAKQIKNDLGTKASLATIRRELNLKIVNRKMKRSPKLTASHKFQRMKFCCSIELNLIYYDCSYSISALN